MINYQETPLLIGNGLSILDHNLGREIDKFKLLVRFNNFQLHPEFTGKRIYYHCRRNCSDISLLPIDKFKKTIGFSTWAPTTPAMRIIANNLKGFYGNKYILIDERWCKKVHDYFKLKFPQRCSVGILAIFYFLEKYEKIILHGFDGKNSAGKVEKYFSKPKDDKFHEFVAEQKFIEEKKKEGKILELRLINH